MKKFVFGLLLAASANSFAFSLPVTESMVNTQIRDAFPKTIKRIELSNPEVTLLQGKSVLCMNGIPRIMFLEKPFRACASFNPQWNAQESRLEATAMELTSLTVEGLGDAPVALRTVLNEAVVLLEPLVLYKSNSWLTKQITGIEVAKGVMHLKF